MSSKTRTRGKGAGSKSEEVSAGPSSAFNMRINPPGKSKVEGAKPKKNSTKPVPAKRPAPPRGKKNKDTKENKVTVIESESESSDSSDEEEVPVQKSSVKSPSKAASVQAQSAVRNNTASKIPPKSSPKSMPSRKNKFSDSESTSSDDSEPELKVKRKAVTSKTEANADESYSDEDDFTIPSASQKKATPQHPPAGLHKKNLTHELNQIHVGSSSESSDSEDTTYESTVEDEEEDGPVGVPKPKAQATAKAFSTNSADTELEDIKAGSEILLKMTDDEVSTFLERLEAASPVLDRKASRDRAKLLNWEAIAFDKWNGEACRKAWSYLRQKRRVRRNLWEVVHEVKLVLAKDVRKFRKDVIETCPGYPPKPPGIAGGLNMYAHVKYNEKKDKDPAKINYIEWYGRTVKEYHGLPAEEKQIWIDKSIKVQAEYQKQLENFYENIGYKPQDSHRSKSKGRSKTAAKIKLDSVKKSDLYPDAPVPPVNPLELFIQFKLDKCEVPPEPDELEELKVKYGRKWHALDNDKKAKWIGKVIENVQEYYSAVEDYKKTHENFDEKPLKISSLLTKSELALWEANQGRPERPPASHIDMIIEELEESGELDSNKSYDEKKTQAEIKYNSMGWVERERYKVSHRNKVVEYVTKIGEYFAALPEFLRPVLISTVDKKFRHEIGGYTGSNESSPKKRKRKDASNSASATTSASSNDSKRKKLETVNSKDILADVEEIKNSLDSSPEAPTKKKKKKKNATLNEIIRGIFDARQDLGHRYSAFYYYGRSVARKEYWVETLELVGIISTANRILAEFVELPKHQKVFFINRSRNFHAERYYQLKIEPDTTAEDLDTHPFPEFRDEPKFPPSTPEGLYTDEMQNIGSKSKPVWKDLPDEIKSIYAKKLYRKTKRYVLDFERFVNQMTPNDLVEYAVSRLKSSNQNFGTRVLNPDFVKKDFIYPFPQHCLPDEDFQVDIISDQQREEERKLAHDPTLSLKSKGVFHNANFLAAVADALDSSSETTSPPRDHQMDSVETRLEFEEQDKPELPSEDLWIDAEDETIKSLKTAARKRNKAELLCNLGDLSSVAFRDYLSEKPRKSKKKKSS